MKAVGKSIVLIMLIIIMTLGGLLWFDYLGVIRAKRLFTPLYALMGLDPQTSKTVTSSVAIVGDIDQERLDKQRDSLDMREEEINKRENEVTQQEQRLEQSAAVLQNDRKSLEEEQKTFNLKVTQYDDKNRNIEQIATNLNGMTPDAAVAILVKMDDQLVIDVLRKVEEIAIRNKANSMGGYWLSLMPSDRAATIQRKMTSKPESLD